MTAAAPPPSPLSPSTTSLLVAHPDEVRPFLIVGCACIVSGGLVAAVTGPTDFELGSWLAAYLVLVGGVAQVALGLGQVVLAAPAPSPRMVVAEAALWNLGLVATITGSLVALPAVSTVGGAATMGALILFLVGVRGAGARPVAVLYRVVVAVVLLSAPIGLVLAWVRHG